MSFFLILWFSLTTTLVAQQDRSAVVLANDTNAKLAKEYIAAYRAAAGKSNAADFLRRATELAPDVADLWYLRAQEEAKVPFNFTVALQSAERAVSETKWVQGNELDAVALFAGYLIRTKRYDDAAAAIDKRFSRQELLKYPQLAAKRIEIYYLQGQRSDGDQVLSECVRRYPMAADFVSLGLHYGGEPVGTAFLWLNRFAKSDVNITQALLWYSMASSPSSDRLSRISDYLKRGGNDQVAFVLGAESELPLLNPPDGQPSYLAADRTREKIEDDWAARFAALKDPLDADSTVALYSMFQNQSAKDIITKRISGANQTFFRDPNHDGVYEEQFLFNNGKIARWDLDQNQDDVIDFEVLWNGDNIASIRHDTPSSSLRLVYADYPEVSAAWYSDAIGTREFQMGHRALEYGFLEFPDSAGSSPIDAFSYLKLPDRVPALNLDRIRTNAFVANEYKPGMESSGPYRQLSLDLGQVRAVREDTNGDGVFDHVVWYETGHPKLGFRDVENSGAFNVLEIYQADRMTEARFVSQKDGITYSFHPQSGRSYWDVNGDNVVDIQEMRVANKALLLDFTEALKTSYDAADWNSAYPMLWTRALIDNR